MKYLIFLPLFLVLFSWKPKPEIIKPIKEENFCTTAEEFQYIVWVSTLPDFDTDLNWAATSGWNKRAMRDEIQIKYRNPYQVLYDMDWETTKINVPDSTSPAGYKVQHWMNGELWWTDHLIGTGSGLFQITGMTGGPGGTWVPGDRGLIHPGTYTNFQTTIHNMNGITFMNDGVHFSGPIIMSGTALYIGGNTNCTFTGTGDINTTYGWQFTGTASNACINISNFNTSCNWDHFWIHDMVNGPIIINTGDPSILFDGVNSNTKILDKCNFSFFLIHGHSGGVVGNFHGDFINVIDSTTWTHFTFDSATAPGIFSGGKYYRDTISYFYMPKIFFGSTSGDHGIFEIIAGTMNYHHNIRFGGSWGWFSRGWYQSLNTPSDSYIYSNINQGNISYGFVETRIDSGGWGAAGVGSPSLNNPKYKAGNVYIINNTCGNMPNTTIYFTPVLLDYGFSIAGFNPYAVNNLRYNSNNTNDGKPDSLNIVDFSGAFGHPIVDKNFYFANPLTSNILNDTTTTWSIKAGASIIGIGNPNFTAFAPTDYNGVSWGATPDIGAVKFGSGPPPPSPCNCIPGSGSHSKAFINTSYHFDIKHEEDEKKFNIYSAHRRDLA